MLHVKVEVSSSARLTDRNKNLFAIPFRGDMEGHFGNVTMTTMRECHQLFSNGISVDEHNAVLQNLSRTIDKYHVCDNGNEPIIVTFNSNNCEESSVDLIKSTYGDVMEVCQSSSHIIQGFILYSQYCHPKLLNDHHKDYIRSAVGNGSGNRCCSTMPTGITNLYYGSRSYPTLAQPSPVVGPNMCSHHNNYRQGWDSARLASMLILSNSLTHAIHHMSRWTNPMLEHLCCRGSKFIGKTEENWQLCRTTIVTFAQNLSFWDL